MNPHFIDIHTHDCAPEADVIRVCTHLLGRNEPLPQGVFTAGLHPWDVGKVPQRALNFFNVLPAGCIGVGETGLDFSLPDADRELQTGLFNQQLAIAERLGLPVIVHCVRAYNETQTILKDYTLKAVIFHGFIGSPELADQLTGQGYHLSFGEPALKSPKTLKSLEHIPFDRLFLETDDHLQSEISQWYATVAELKGVSTESLKELIYDNYRRIFNG